MPSSGVRRPLAKGRGCLPRPGSTGSDHTVSGRGASQAPGGRRAGLPQCPLLCLSSEGSTGTPNRTRTSCPDTDRLYWALGDLGAWGLEEQGSGVTKLQKKCRKNCEK